MIILKYWYQERKHFFEGCTYEYLTTTDTQLPVNADYRDSNLTSFQYGRLNAIIKLFESITSLSDKRIIHFCPLLTLLPYDESVPLDSFVGMRSLT